MCCAAAQCRAGGWDLQPTTATQPATAPSGINIPIDYYKLDNGLKVVLSRETTAPTVTVGVYYHIGFRIEPRGRTGFAHLFEHLMFQGSGNLGKMEFIRLVEGNGGVLNGSTRFDFTNYFQIVPAHTLESVLWAEADRMKALAITQANLVNQQGVVKNEVRDATMNQPYGGFPWLSMPQVANQNWYNAHNFYGDLADLDAATLEDAKAFFDTYYAPNNAVLVVAGDFDPASARAWIEKYFAALPARAQPARPDLTEPEQQAEKQDTYVDRLAPRPALALAWQVPDRGTPEHYAFSLLDHDPAAGRGQSPLAETGAAARLFQRASAAAPTCSATSSPTTARCSGCFISSTTRRLRRRQSSRTWTLKSRASQPSRRRRRRSTRALTKLRASLYDLAGSSTRFGLLDLLACFRALRRRPGRASTVLRPISARYRPRSSATWRGST